MTKNRFVAFIDILGFKNFVDTNTHQQVLNSLKLVKKSLEEIENREAEDLRTWIFSDSILVMSNNDTYSAADAIMISVCQIVEHSLKLGLLVKGVISHGKFTADFENSIFFGKPLIDSYLLQEEIKLSSIVLHHTFEKKVSQFTQRPKLFDGGRTLHFNTPLQNGSVNHLHLNWMEYYSFCGIDDKQKQKEIDKHTKSLKKLYFTVSGRSRVYIDNTIKFFEACAEVSVQK